MRAGTVAALVAVAVAAVAVGWYFGTSTSPREQTSVAGGTLMFPGLADKLHDAVKVEITHQGKQILFIDMTNCVSEEAMLIASEVQRVVTAQPRNSVLTLSDLTGGKFRRDAITRMKEVAVFDRPYVKRAAIVGAESLPNVFYEALKTFSQREFPRFNTREEAMNWLVREET